MPSESAFLILENPPKLDNVNVEEVERLLNEDGPVVNTQT